jgi:hypothetical protein
MELYLLCPIMSLLCAAQLIKHRANIVFYHIPEMSRLYKVFYCNLIEVSVKWKGTLHTVGRSCHLTSWQDSLYGATSRITLIDPRIANP